MYAIRKRDLKSFTPDAYSVCRIEAGNSNTYLKETRTIEEILKTVEPGYNSAVEKLQDDSIDRGCIYIIAGFVAYVLTCSPAAMRLQSAPMKHMIEETARALDKMGKIPTPPAELAGGSFTELLNSDQICVEVDPKYPQAVGITSIFSMITTFGNFKWEILLNTIEDSPFFTSDFPVALEQTANWQIQNRIVPLTPSLAIRICPDFEHGHNQVDFSFPRFRRVIRKLTRQEILVINRLLVSCAETTVFFRDSYEWVPEFVKKYADFRLGIRPIKTGGLNGFTHEIERF